MSMQAQIPDMLTIHCICTRQQEQVVIEKEHDNSLRRSTRPASLILDDEDEVEETEHVATRSSRASARLSARPGSSACKHTCAFTPKAHVKTEHTTAW